MINRSTIITALLLISGSFQLSLFGILPYNFKIFGDLVFFVVCAYALQSGMVRPLQDRWSSLVFKFALLFIGLSVFLVLYSVFIWGNYIQTMQWSRRWIISGVYILLSSSTLVRQIHWKMVRAALFMFPAIAATAQYLERSGIYDFAGIRSNMEWQGGFVVIKMFTPTAPLIMIAFILNVYRLLVKPNPLNVILCLAWSYIFFDLINFRGYWIAGVSSLLISILIVIFIRGTGFSLVRKRVLASLMCGMIFVFAFGYQSIVQSLDGRIAWLHSAVTDAGQGSGNIQWRLQKDASRLEAVWDGPAWLFKIYGVGFVGENSKGSTQLGFTSETNDSGWVEVLLTGGIPAALTLVLLWGSNIIRLFSIARKSATAASLASLATAMSAAVLMYTSNYLLWDFGFVPMFWIQALALSKETGMCNLSPTEETDSYSAKRPSIKKLPYSWNYPSSAMPVLRDK